MNLHCKQNVLKKKQKESIERVQRRATKVIPKIKDLPYNERLKKLKLPTLTYRRHRGDMIETYKILTNKYDQDITPKLSIDSASITRGHPYKLKKHRSTTRLRQHYFTNIIIEPWNNLITDIVTAKSVKHFEIKLDNYWKDQGVLYNYDTTLKSVYYKTSSRSHAHNNQTEDLDIEDLN